MRERKRKRKEKLWDLTRLIHFHRCNLVRFELKVFDKKIRKWGRESVL